MKNKVFPARTQRDNLGEEGQNIIMGEKEEEEEWGQNLVGSFLLASHMYLFPLLLENASQSFKPAFEMSCFWLDFLPEDTRGCFRVHPNVREYNYYFSYVVVFIWFPNNPHSKNRHHTRAALKGTLGLHQWAKLQGAKIIQARQDRLLDWADIRWRE